MTFIVIAAPQNIVFLKKKGSLNFAECWTKVNPLYLLYLLSTEVLFSASDKAKVFAEIFSENSNLGDSGIFLPSIPFATNFKLLNIAATPKLFRKVIIYFDFWMASGPDCIPVVVLKNCEPELCILAKYFNMCPKEACFQIVGNSHLWSLYLIKLEKGLGPKIIPLLVFFLSFVKSLKNLWMIGLLITLKNVVFFLISNMGSGFSRNCRSSNSCI